MEGCVCDNMKMISSVTPQSGLGQIDIATGILSFASGLFGKDPQKSEYDRVRQDSWDSLVQLVDLHEEYKANGQLSRTILQQLIDTLSQLMAGFKKYTDGMLSKYPADSAWITPRFHDYYDFMVDVKAGWQQEMATLPADWSVSGAIDYVQDIFIGSKPSVSVPNFPNTPVTDPITGAPIQRPAAMDTTSMLLIGGVVVGLILMSRKRG